MKGNTQTEEHSSESEACDGVWKCPNCRNVETEAPDSPQDICPDCSVEKMSEMDPVECPSCGGTEFALIRESDGITGPDPTATCVSCGRSGEVDDSGVWW